MVAAPFRGTEKAGVAVMAKRRSHRQPDLTLDNTPLPLINGRRSWIIR